MSTLFSAVAKIHAQNELCNVNRTRKKQDDCLSRPSGMMFSLRRELMTCNHQSSTLHYDAIICK
jgi:hypothetical protein